MKMLLGEIDLLTFYAVLNTSNNFLGFSTYKVKRPKRSKGQRRSA